MMKWFLKWFWADWDKHFCWFDNCYKTPFNHVVKICNLLHFIQVTFQIRKFSLSAYILTYLNSGCQSISLKNGQLMWYVLLKRQLWMNIFWDAENDFNKITILRKLHLYRLKIIFRGIYSPSQAMSTVIS